MYRSIGPPPYLLPRSRAGVALERRSYAIESPLSPVTVPYIESNVNNCSTGHVNRLPKSSDGRVFVAGSGLSVRRNVRRRFLKKWQRLCREHAGHYSLSRRATSGRSILCPEGQTCHHDQQRLGLQQNVGQRRISEQSPLFPCSPIFLSARVLRSPWNIREPSFLEFMCNLLCGGCKFPGLHRQTAMPSELTSWAAILEWYWAAYSEQREILAETVRGSTNL